MKLLIVLFFCLGLFLFVGCGKSSSSSSTGATSLATIPAATGAVSSSSSVSLASVGILSRGALDLQLATTGIAMSTFSGLTWDSGKSGAFCQVGSMTKDLFSEASEIDKIRCYVGVGEANNIFTPVYDGQYHYLQFSNSGMASAPKIKYKLAKNSDGLITTFEMFQCFDQSSQDGYILYDYSSGAVTLTSVGNHSGDSGFSGAQRTVASGSVNSDGSWSGTETITHKGTFTGGSGSNAFNHKQYMLLTRAPSKVTLSGYFSGTFGSGNTSQGQVYAVMQTLGEKLTNLFFGGGTTKFTFTWGSSTYTSTKAWNGDTRAPLSDVTAGDYYSAVNSATLPSIDTITVSYATSEAWDCTAPSGSSFTAADFAGFNSGAGAAGIAACDAKYSFRDSSHMRCESASFN